MVAKIKFCGIVQPGDATLAAEAGAGYLSALFLLEVQGQFRLSEQGRS